MHITRIEFAGKGTKATAEPFDRRRDDGTPLIYTKIHHAETGEILAEDWAAADDRDEMWRMAEIMQFALDGFKGAESDIDGYYRALAHLA